VQLIVNSGNDYLVGIKGNQPKLLSYAQTLTQQLLPDTIDIQIERTRGRVVQRSVKVYELLDGIDPSWEKAQSLIVVERQGSRDGQAFETLSYYLSSLKTSALNSLSAAVELLPIVSIIMLELACLYSSLDGSIKLNHLSLVRE
jgi:hypothetical protein